MTLDSEVELNLGAGPSYTEFKGAPLALEDF